MKSESNTSRNYAFRSHDRAWPQRVDKQRIYQTRQDFTGYIG